MTIEKAMAELASETKIERLHADVIDRVERYINQYHGGECDMRVLIRVIIKQLAAENHEKRERNARVGERYDQLNREGKLGHYETPSGEGVLAAHQQGGKCTTEISVVEDQGGYFVHLTVNGNIEATKGPFDKDHAHMIAKELAQRAANTPKLRGFQQQG